MEKFNTAVMRKISISPSLRPGLLVSGLLHLMILVLLGWNMHSSPPEEKSGAQAVLWASTDKILLPPTVSPSKPVQEERFEPPQPARKVEAEPVPPSAAPPKIVTARERAPTKPKPALKKEEKEEKEEKVVRKPAPKVVKTTAAALPPSLVAPANTKLQEQREANLQRLLQQAAQGTVGTATDASTTRGPSAGYAARIKAQIKPNIVFTSLMTANPVAEVRIKVAPDGKILQKEKQLVRSSGVQDWDEAVMRAIDRTEFLPLDTDGKIPSVMVLEFRPRD
jgi:colicin import membrane protein